MARKRGTSVRNSDVVKPQSAKFEPSTILTRSRTMQNLAHLQKTETTRTICTRSKTLENKPVMQRTKAILAQTRETEPTIDCRRITRLRYAEARQKASENQAIGRKIADVPPIRPSAPVKPSKTKPLPKKKKDQAPSSIQSSCQKLAKSEAANKSKANAVVAKTRKQTTSDKVQHNPLPSKERSTNASCPYMLRNRPKNKGPVQKRDSIKVRSRSVTVPSSESELHTVAECSTSVLHRRLCYDEEPRERIRKPNMKKNQCKPQGPCSPTVKQMISPSNYSCPAAPIRGKSISSLDSRRLFPCVYRKLVFDEDVPKLERVLGYTKFKASYSENFFQEEPVTYRSDYQRRASPRVVPSVCRKLTFDEESSTEFSTLEKACPSATRNVKSTSFFDGRGVLSSFCRGLVKIIRGGLVKIISGGDVFSPAPSTPLARELHL